MAIRRRTLRGPEGQVRIAYGAVRNTNTHRGGFCPIFWNNGRPHGNRYCRGYDREEACRQARADAREESGRYAGDWDIRFTDRCATGGKKTKRAGWSR